MDAMERLVAPAPAPMSREEIVDAVEALAESPRRAYVEQILAEFDRLTAALAAAKTQIAELLARPHLDERGD